MRRAILLAACLLLLAGGCAPRKVEGKVYLPLAGQATLLPLRKGVGMHTDYAEEAHAVLLNTSWHYTWYENPPSYSRSEAVPMVKDATRIGKTLGGSSEWIMWFNEPDVPSQANLTPQEAASLYNQHRGEYLGREHVSPGVSDIDWLVAWLPLVTIKPDALAIHIYGTGSLVSGKLYTIQQLDAITALAAQYNIQEVWLTEIALVVSDFQEQAEYAVWLFSILPGYQQVTRIAWFVATMQGNEPWHLEHSTNLIDFYDGTLTPVGVTYAAMPAHGGLAEDINNDGCVDILDLVSVASVFGLCYQEE